MLKVEKVADYGWTLYASTEVALSLAWEAYEQGQTAEQANESAAKFLEDVKAKFSEYIEICRKTTAEHFDGIIKRYGKKE